MCMYNTYIKIKKIYCKLLYTFYVHGKYKAQTKINIRGTH